jgi:hypothetical protein
MHYIKVANVLLGKAAGWVDEDLVPDSEDAG